MWLSVICPLQVRMYFKLNVWLLVQLLEAPPKDQSCKHEYLLLQFKYLPKHYSILFCSVRVKYNVSYCQSRYYTLLGLQALICEFWHVLREDGKRPCAHGTRTDVPPLLLFLHHRHLFKLAPAPAWLTWSCSDSQSESPPRYLHKVTARHWLGACCCKPLRVSLQTSSPPGRQRGVLK